jgi:hypothetical protein
MGEGIREAYRIISGNGIGGPVKKGVLQVEESITLCYCCAQKRAGVILKACSGNA